MRTEETMTNMVTAKVRILHLVQSTNPPIGYLSLLVAGLKEASQLVASTKMEVDIRHFLVLTSQSTDFYMFIHTTACLQLGSGPLLQSEYNKIRSSHGFRTFILASINVWVMFGSSFVNKTLCFVKLLHM